VDVVKVLGSVSLFSGLPERDLELLAEIALPRTFKGGELIFSEGDEGRGFYVVVEGRVEVFKLSPEGRKQVLHFLGPGEPFGEVAVFSGRSFPAHAAALKDSHLLFFPREAFIRLMEEHPPLILRMLAVLARRLREFAALIEDLSLKEVSGRLAGYILSLREGRGGSEEVELEVSKGQLANLLGTAPETLSRALARLSKAGLIEVEGRSIRILDQEGLAQLAAHEG